MNQIADRLHHCPRLPTPNLPPDVWDQIASHDFSLEDVEKISSLGKYVKSSLEPRLQSLRCADQASRMDCLAEMSILLQEIGHLPSIFKSEPLRQIMWRLHALPLRDRGAGLASFRAALRDPALGFEHRPSEPPRLDRIVHYPDVQPVVWSRNRVYATTRIFNSTTQSVVWALETQSRACPPAAKLAMQAGGHVQTVAQQFRITSAEGLRELECFTTTRPELPDTAAAAVSAGAHVPTVAHEFGVTSIQGRRELERVTTTRPDLRGTAAAEVSAGRHVPTVAQQFDITSPEGLRELERLSTTRWDLPNTAAAAMLHGGHVGRVARVFGITSAEGVRELEGITATYWSSQGTAAAAVLRGGHVQTVAERFGVTSQEGLEELERMAADHWLRVLVGGAGFEPATATV